MEEQVYMVTPREYLNDVIDGVPIMKIGMHRTSDMKRVRSYGQGTVVHQILPVKKSIDAERILKAVFRYYFGKPVYGNEHFRCKALAATKALYLFYDLCAGEDLLTEEIADICTCEITMFPHPDFVEYNTQIDKKVDASISRLSIEGQIKYYLEQCKEMDLNQHGELPDLYMSSYEDITKYSLFENLYIQTHEEPFVVAKQKNDMWYNPEGICVFWHRGIPDVILVNKQTYELTVGYPKEYRKDCWYFHVYCGICEGKCAYTRGHSTCESDCVDCQRITNIVFKDRIVKQYPVYELQPYEQRVYVTGETYQILNMKTGTYTHPDDIKGVQDNVLYCGGTYQMFLMVIHKIDINDGYKLFKGVLDVCVGPSCYDWFIDLCHSVFIGSKETRVFEESTNVCSLVYILYMFMEAKWWMPYIVASKDEYKNITGFRKALKDKPRLVIIPKDAKERISTERTIFNECKAAGVHSLVIKRTGNNKKYNMPGAIAYLIEHKDKWLKTSRLDDNKEFLQNPSQHWAFKENDLEHIITNYIPSYFLAWIIRSYQLKHDMN